MALVIVANDIPSAGAALPVERLRTGRIYPLNGSLLSLVGSGGPGPLVAQRRDLKSLLLLILLNLPIALTLIKVHGSCLVDVIKKVINVVNQVEYVTIRMQK